MSSESAVQPSERLVVLDVLRGIALLGMFFVHFNDNATEPGSGPELVYRGFVELFFSEQFWTMFAILFGAGFAVQLRRAVPGDGAFMWRYGRRLLALAAFGLVAEVGFGYNVLLSYAVWGVLLLLVRRWSNRALVILLLVCAAGLPLRNMARAAYLEAIGSPEQFDAERQTAMKQYAAARQEYEAAQGSTDYGTVVSGRLRFIPPFYSQWFTVLPVNSFVFFLIGLLALRFGLFDEPQRHRRIIVAMMIFGVLSWAADTWLLPLFTPDPSSPLLVRVVVGSAGGAFRLIRHNWLALTYIGAILLLVSRPAWQRLLGSFAITGRMALTNYMLQVALLDLTFSNYAFGAHISAWLSPVAALVLFGADVALSRWWLSRFSYGPLEWLWRSATYARWQPIRHRVAVVEAGL